MNGPTLLQRRFPTLAGGAVERCCSTLQTLAFWLAVGLPVAYVIAMLYPIGPLSTVDGLMTVLGVHALALVIGHREHANRKPVGGV